MKKFWSRWRWGLLAAVLWAGLAAYPQIYLLISLGPEYQGLYASAALDEVAYMAYVRALSEGRPRRNDPHTGRDEASAGPQPESLFSVQFAPPYLVAKLMRWLGLSIEKTFISLSLLVAAFSALAIFWLAGRITGDEKLAAAAPFFVLGLGTLAAGQGAIRHFLTLPYLIPQSVADSLNGTSCYYLPFLRLYQPGVGFPLFFVFCGLAWAALTNGSRRYALGAGVCFTVLVFCYFFLWTAAAAWLACAAALWFAARADERGRGLRVLGIIGAVVLTALTPYFWLLSQRSATTDSVQLLQLTRRPELWRAPEVLGAVTLALLVWGVWRGRLRWRDNATLFTISLALLPFAVLNQQVITGRLLQPFHYQWYIANYAVVLAAVLAAWLTWRAQPEESRVWRDKRLLACALAALAWGAGEVWLAAGASLRYNQRMNEAQPVMRLLAAQPDGQNVIRPETPNPRPLILVADFTLADRAPVNIPQALLWTPHLLVFPSVSAPEAQERFWLQLYLSGFDNAKFLNTAEIREWSFFAGMFDYEKLSPVLANKGISGEDIRQKQSEYLAFAAGVTPAQVARYPLSGFVARFDKLPDFTNLDRWYERDAGTRAGVYTLYRLKLKTATSAAH
jgi:hypothetical protein